MKKIILSLSFLALAPIAVNAQDGLVDGFIELLRSDIRAEKVAVLTAAMGLDAQQAEGFWPLQREYEGSLAGINDERLKLIKRYAEQWGTLTNDQAASIAKASFAIQEQRLKLRKSTYKKMGKEIGELAAARFIQIENAMQMLLDLQISAELPILE